MFCAMDEPFDPLSGLFVAQSERPAHLRPLNLRALAPAQRALLVIDGTVTKFLEAFTMERVQVVQLGQQGRSLDEPHPWLEAEADEEVVDRDVMLRGAWSGTEYAYATSVIVPDRLPEEPRRLLLEGEVGLGRILLASALENRREVLWCGRSSGVDLPPALAGRAEQEFIVRSYRIIAGGAPLMMITERFPAIIEHSLFDA